MINKLLDLLYPPKCAFCGKILDDGEDGVCRHCSDTMEVLRGRAAHTKGDFFADAISPLYYSDKVRDAILRYKFNGRSGYARIFSAIIADCVKDEYGTDFDILTYVPISRKRLRRRGYDQAKLLAEGVGENLGLMPEAVLTKTVHNRQQSGISGAEKRRANVLGVYEVTDKERVRGKKILLIDDIHTTGATLSECSKTLLLAGAEEIFCASIAKTR